MDSLRRTSSVIDERARIINGATKNDPGPPRDFDRDGTMRLTRPTPVSAQVMYEVLSEDDEVESALPTGWVASNAMVPNRHPYLDKKAAAWH